MREVYFARDHYRANLAMVVSRSGFTKQAREVAGSEKVKLFRLSDLRRGCEFDRSAEWERIKRQREAEEGARRDREEAEARARRAKEEAAARARADAERQAREKAERERREAQNYADWNAYDRDLAAHRQKSAVYEHRWTGVLSP